MTALLTVSELSKSFGALSAVNSVSFSLERGELLGLIGPNGAGKSTLYNLLSGAIKPSSGEIRFKGDVVTGWRPYHAARAGLARTFQIPKPYSNLTVLDNVALSALLHERTVAAAREAAMAVLGEVRLTERAESPVGFLTAGQMKLLEVARALALRPTLVLFDEIMAGLTRTEIMEMTSMVASLPSRGISVIWVEHVLYAIMKAAPRILVLDRGGIIADGPPEELVKDPAVIKAYLGEEKSPA